MLDLVRVRLLTDGLVSGYAGIPMLHFTANLSQPIDRLLVAIRAKAHPSRLQLVEVCQSCHEPLELPHLETCRDVAEGLRDGESSARVGAAAPEPALPDPEPAPMALHAQPGALQGIPDPMPRQSTGSFTLAQVPARSAARAAAGAGERRRNGGRP